MKYIYSLLAVAILAVGAYTYYIAGIRTTSKVERRYLACVESGKESSQCLIEEMNLRALTSCK